MTKPGRSIQTIGVSTVICNVGNFPKPAAGQAALLSFTDVTTMFHRVGHALHGILADCEYPSLPAPPWHATSLSSLPSSTSMGLRILRSSKIMRSTMRPARPCLRSVAAKLSESKTFNQGYALTEVLVAASLDLQWHTQGPDTKIESPDAFEKGALERTQLLISYVPPRYRSSYFAHIFTGGYAAGYYAYLWAEMLRSGWVSVVPRPRWG